MKAIITDYEYENVDQEHQIIEAAGFECKDYHVKNGQELIDICSDADAVITQYSDVNAEVIKNMKNCKMIIKYGIGVNNIDVETATAKGIFVCNIPDYGVQEVSDHAITLMLCLAKKLPVLTKSLKAGHWGYQSIEPIYRFEESSVGLLGFGRIPRLVAKKLNGFGVKILAYDPFITAEAMESENVTKADLETIFKTCDFISAHVPLNKDTADMINAKTIEMMKPTVNIINTSRGGIIDENALIDALKKKRICGAALDVYANEPISKDSPLLTMDNVICTPHCAWYSEKALENLHVEAAKEVVNVLKGNVPFHCVNIKKLK